MVCLITYNYYMMFGKKTTTKTILFYLKGLPKMKNPRAEEILQEISRLREILHKVYNKNKKVTKEVLLVSTELDHSINSYIKLLYQENSN
jgi:hypothetical protein